PYSIGRQHRHLPEMEEQLTVQARPAAAAFQVIFSPHLLPVNRGILSTMYVELPEKISGEALLGLYRDTYRDEPFIHLLGLNQVATLRHTVNSNRCALGLSPQADNLLIVTSSIDNLLKGASGQAVQNMNAMWGLPETTALL
ncbi:MAG: Asd/ArgC dimerization domain-containing protein, partial [Anaerolineae bacterium]